MIGAFGSTFKPTYKSYWVLGEDKQKVMICFFFFSLLEHLRKDPLRVPNNSTN